MKITVFGATGRTGMLVVQQALTAGHTVTAFVRNPSKLQLKDERFVVVQGDIENPAQVEQAIAGAAAVISVLAPTSNMPDYKVSRGMQHIIAAMKKQGVRRLIVSTGAGVSDPNDAPKLFNKLMNVLLNIMAKHVYEDMRRTVDVLRASDLDWTIVRVPMLTNDPPKGQVRVGYVGKGTGPRLSRADMADFIVKQLNDRRYLRQAPAISN